MVKLSNTADFVVKARKIYGDLYDYSNVIYVNCESKVKINCKILGYLRRPQIIIYVEQVVLIKLKVF